MENNYENKNVIEKIRDRFVSLMRQKFKNVNVATSFFTFVMRAFIVILFFSLFSKNKRKPISNNIRHGETIRFQLLSTD